MEIKHKIGDEVLVLRAASVRVFKIKRIELYESGCETRVLYRGEIKNGYHDSSNPIDHYDQENVFTNIEDVCKHLKASFEEDARIYDRDHSHLDNCIYWKGLPVEV